MNPQTDSPQWMLKGFVINNVLQQSYISLESNLLIPNIT